MALPKNPRRIIFAPSVDHDAVTAYEVDLVSLTTGRTVATLNIGKPALNAAGDCEAEINVQPYAFDRYVDVARALAPSVTSENSDQSNEWERAPGRPGRPTLG